MVEFGKRSGEGAGGVGVILSERCWDIQILSEPQNGFPHHKWDFAKSEPPPPPCPRLRDSLSQLEPITARLVATATASRFRVCVSVPQLQFLQGTGSADWLVSRNEPDPAVTSHNGNSSISRDNSIQFHCKRSRPPCLGEKHTVQFTASERWELKGPNL